MNDKHFTPKDDQALQKIAKQLDPINVPILSSQEKDSIFRQAWLQSHPQKSNGFLLDLWRRPAVTFALGLVLGCVVMFACLRPHVARAAKTDSTLTVESLGSTQTYTGKALQGLYPHIENPKLVVEKTDQDSTPRRVLYGTLDDGDVYVVWNL